MCINPKDIETTDTKKPQVFLKNITFNDGTKLSLNHNSVIVFTGANNSGKSQALRDIETGLDKSNYLKTIVIKDIEYDFLGNIDEVTFFSEHFSMNQDGFYEVLELGRNFDKSTILDYWQNHA